MEEKMVWGKNLPIGPPQTLHCPSRVLLLLCLSIHAKPYSDLKERGGLRKRKKKKLKTHRKEGGRKRSIDSQCIWEGKNRKGGPG